MLEVKQKGQLGTPYTEELSFRNKEDMKAFPDRKLGQFITTKTALQEIPVRVMQVGVRRAK